MNTGFGDAENLAWKLALVVRGLLPIGNLRSVQRRNAAAASQLSVSYRRGPLGGFALGRRPRPGDRLHDRECVRMDGAPTRLHGELGGHWVLLLPGTGADACVTAAADRLRDYLAPLARTDQAGEVWLVRPDAHLAWRGRPDPTALGRWLDAALRHGRVRR